MTYVPKKWRVVVQFNREGYKPYLSRASHLFSTFDEAFEYMCSLKHVEQGEERQLDHRTASDDNAPNWTPMIRQTYEVWEWKITLAAMILIIKKLQQLENNASLAFSLSIGYDGFGDVDGLKSLIDDMAKALKGELENG
jgi:hypothetical protein